jgi:signal transduction histidine kinase
LLNRAGGFGEDHLKLLTLIGGQVGRAITMYLEREERERADRLSHLGQMVATILHDVKTPIAIISGYVQLMALEDNAESRNKLTAEVIKQFDLLNVMTKEVLSFARGDSSILASKVFVGDFMKEITEHLTLEFAGSGVVIKLDLQYAKATRFDPNKMKRVFYNLARNAKEAMPEGGEFKITAKKEDCMLLFSFSDTGTGIPEALKSRLFESFATYGKKGGTGLGLAVVKTIVDAHSGSIAVDSIPGQGTVFTISLPMGEV